jgi:probable FeS assembly SUF system protein SufT
MIPSGERVLLNQGTEVRITQSLGGCHTVMGVGVMARIDGKDADALGLAAEAPVPEPGAQAPAPGPLDEETVWQVLRTCYDPEIPVNVVDLGLIYDLNLQTLPTGKHQVTVKMTLTAPGCGMGDVLAKDVSHKIMELPGVAEANVELVWDPPWHQTMMTEAARLQLGLM